jgi:branched-chain amino acid transport system permease protein
MKKLIFKSRYYILILAALFLASVPVWDREYVLLFCMFFCFYLSLSQMWNLLAGYSGLISLGQQTFIGLGGYTVAVTSNYYGLNIYIGILLGGVVSVVMALVMSLFIFRMKGVFFAIGTWIFAEVVLLYFSNWKYVKYGSGMFVRPEPELSNVAIYYAALFLGLGSVILVYLILRSRLGLGLMAMRDQDEAAATLGVRTFRSKLICFLITAMVTGMTAGIIYTFQVFVQPFKAFAIDWTVTLVFIVIIGGIGTIEGPIVGTLVYVTLSQYLADYASISMLILGGVAIVVIVLAPKGIMGWVQDKLGFEFLSPRRF